MARLPLARTDGDLLAIAMNIKILLRQFLQELFAFGAPSSIPQTLAGAGDARSNMPILPFHLGCQQVVVGSDLVGFDQVGIVKRRHGEIAEKE
jgi:hypothetical protein